MGLVHVYCGDGKGKTTCSIGLCIRYIGSGGNVLFYQFMKNQNSSELEVLNNIDGVTVIEGYKMDKFSFQMTDLEKKEVCKIYAVEFEKIKNMAISGQYGLLVMDEIMSCISCGFLSESDVISFIKSRPKDLEIVMTGRNPSNNIIECADYVSEISKVKHPYDGGINARKGIEF